MQSAVAIYNDGRNNYQTNFSGSNVVMSFESDMKNRNVKWGKLLDVQNGDVIASYPSKASQLPDECECDALGSQCDTCDSYESD